MKLRAFVLTLLSGLILLTSCATQATPSDKETQLEDRINKLEQRISQLEEQLRNLSKDIRLEQEEAIAFTKSALEIEAERDGIVAKYAKGWNRLSYAPSLRAYLASPFKDEVEGKLKLSTGVVSLRNKLALLDCPSFLLDVKIMLLQAYELELESTETVTRQGSLGEEEEVKGFNPSINKDNAMDYQKMLLDKIRNTGANPFGPAGETLWKELHSPWVEAQLIRREAYERWAKILREHGIDPLEQGFTELAKY